MKEGTTMKKLNSDSKIPPAGKKRAKAKRKVFVAAAALCAAMIPKAMVYASNPAFAALSRFMEDARTFIIGISIAGLIVGLGIGAFYKYLSNGDPQKIQTGNKIIIGSIVGFAVINGVSLIVQSIAVYTGNPATV